LSEVWLRNFLRLVYIGNEVLPIPLDYHDFHIKMTIFPDTQTHTGWSF
jgi:hypothetical protein